MRPNRRGIERRTLLRSLGAAAAAATAGGLWRALDQHAFSLDDGEATAPWASWRGDAADGPVALVHAAVLAASPHNTQPWRFRVSPERIELFADEARNLGALDGDRREMQLGLGCALENLLVAAGPHGFAARATYAGAAAPNAPVAAIALAPAAAASSALFDAVPRRHTNRGPFRARDPLSASFVAVLEGAGSDLPEARLVFWRSSSDRAAFARETVAASAAIVADEEQARDSARWLRFDADEIARRRDGLTVDSLGLPPLLRAVVKTLPAPGRRRIDEGWLRATEEVHCATAPLFGAVVVRDDRSLPARLAAGRLWQRVQLLAALEGIAGQPLSQLVERRDREVELGLAPRFGDALRHLVGSSAWSAALPFRLGYPVRGATASPRRDPASVLV